MSHVTMEPAVLSRLLASHGLVEVRDSAGNVVGHFMPLQAGIDQETVRSLFDLDKARETLKKQYGQGSSLQEIWARLQA